MASAPEWLIDYLTGSGTSFVAPTTTAPDSPNGDYLDLRTAPGASEGGRHDAATRYVGAELGRGTDPVDVLDWAYSWSDKCDPPMDRDEVKRIVNDFAARDIRKLDEAIDAQPRKPECPTLGEEAYHGLAGDIVRVINQH